ncbi:MAG: GDP-mannose 4,6-dehydratase [Gammaproteobacteria bacterium]|nr:GDP-mannose 4,6-dehydratase [Gammaproteobacteria bacterium]
MSKPTVLITGVAGFIGSNLLEKLLNEGHRVVGIDNLSMGLMSNMAGALDNPDFTFIEADLTDMSAFDTVADDIDVAVHLAAYKIPRYGKAIDTLKINYYTTENILEFCRMRNIKCVLASTSDVYGKNPDVPFSEEKSLSVIGSSKSPRWSYAVSKLFDEHLALAYQDAYGFPVTLMRFFGSYGPRQPLSWWGGPPPVFIEAILKDEEIPIHGDGMQTRSFTFVSDTVDGVYACIMRDEANGEFLNIGNEEEVTILELAKRVKKATGTPGELKVRMVPYESFTNKKYEDVMRRVPDTTFSEKILGVKARISLDEGLKRTVEWQIGAMAERDK